MKRYGNLIGNIADRWNVDYADQKARRGKCSQAIIDHDRHNDTDNGKLCNDLRNATYKTSKYTTFKIHEPKERTIFKLPYYPDRIAHHAILNVLEPVWVKTFIPNTYACIKGRGILKLKNDLYRDLRRYPERTTYCLKLDVHKFYPSIDHDVLKGIIRGKIKDKALLKVLDNIIDSAKGVPIGNYLSQFFGNLFLNPLDHYCKEVLKTRYYYRYCDDIVILSDSKEYLHKVLDDIRTYLVTLKLELKPNYQIFPVDTRGIDFVGYKFYHDHVLLRKSIKLRTCRCINKYKKGSTKRMNFLNSISSYYGWMTHCDCKHLAWRIECLTGIHLYIWNGIKSSVSRFYGKNIHIVNVVPHSKYYTINFIYKHKAFIVKSTDAELFGYILTGFEYNYYNIRYERSKKNRVRQAA